MQILTLTSRNEVTPDTLCFIKSHSSK